LGGYNFDALIIIIIIYLFLSEKKNGGTPPSLIGFEMNLIDTMWPTRPKIPKNKLVLHPIELAGESVSAKLTKLRESLVKDCGGEAIVVSALDQVCVK
jgi:hypothetical protein